MTLNIVVTVPPDPDIYFDVAYMPNPFTVSVPVCIANNETVDLYFKAVLVNPPADWQVASVELGLVAAGGSACFLAEFSRLQPTLTAGEYSEQLTLRIEAYSDATYTTLYGYQDIQVTFNFIDHTDPAWTIISYENFDTGLEALNPWGCGTPTIDPIAQYCGRGISSSRFLTGPYSLASTTLTYGALRRSYTIGAYTKAYIVIHVYSAVGTTAPGRFAVRINNTLVKPGRVPAPNNRWIRITYPLIPNASNTVELGTINAPLYIDDVIVVVK